jgi:hypothetical protein
MGSNRCVVRVVLIRRLTERAEYLRLTGNYRDRQSVAKNKFVGFPKMATADVENGEDNILYDLTVHAEWKQENEPFVRLKSYIVSIILCFCTMTYNIVHIFLILKICQSFG